MYNYQKVLQITGLVLGMIILWGCQEQKTSQNHGDPENIEAIKSIIKKKNTQIESWYKRGMVDSLASAFAPNVVQFPPNLSPVVGKQAFTDWWIQSLKAGKWDFNRRTQDIKISGSIAVELGKYTLNFEPYSQSPMPAFSDKGNYVVLWEKFDGDWKIVWDAPVSEVPSKLSR
ncbi:DUF4440 domain-containing protein [Aquiflexum sp.]|uniref:YybH family protein n=1 Tax=Aquiflexum sp. TaxID=1872584 RepID=UPI0035936D16